MDTTPSTTQRVTQSSFAAMAGVLVSRASGVLRTIIVNATFGASTALDAFNAAFRLPNSLRDLFADGALSAAFMTALIPEKEKGHEEERQLIGIVLGFFGVLTLILAILGILFAPQIIQLMTDNKFKVNGGLPIGILIFQFLVFYLPITMVNAVSMAVLGIHGQSFRAMNGSVFLSIGMIVGALVFAPLLQFYGEMGIYGLAIGALVGALLQLIYQMLPLKTLNLLPLPNLNPRIWLNYRPLRKILIQMGPRALGQGALVLALSMNTYFATRIGTGFLTYIVTAVTIIQVPIGLFGVATGFAALPALLSALTARNTPLFSRLLVEGLRTSFWLAGITTLCFALLIFPFYVVLFQHGKIVFEDSINNCIAICIYATGIVLASGNKVLLNTLYALDGTRQIVYNAIFYFLLNAALNILLVPTFGLLGIGFSFGVATSVDFWLNYFAIRRFFHKKGFRSSPYRLGGKYFAYKILGLNLASFTVCLIGVAVIKNFWFHHPLSFVTALEILILGGVVLGGLFYLAVVQFGPPHLQRLFINFLKTKK